MQGLHAIFDFHHSAILHSESRFPFSILCSAATKNSMAGHVTHHALWCAGLVIKLEVWHA